MFTDRILNSNYIIIKRKKEIIKKMIISFFIHLLVFQQLLRDYNLTLCKYVPKLLNEQAYYFLIYP